jgi:hypothetical protein
MSQQRTAGFLVLAGILVAIVWRVAVAPAVLGDFDPSDMPHRDRAFLSIGNVFISLTFAAALWLIAGLLHETRFERLARLGGLFGFAAAAIGALATVGLVWWQAAIFGLDLYVFCMGVAWAATGYAAFVAFAGPRRWAALATAVAYALAAAAIFLGAFIIFVMTIAALPFAIALVAGGTTRIIPAAGPPDPRLVPASD